MSASERQEHWEKVYTTKSEREVSWFQETPAPSLELLALIGATRRSAVIDVGGGASRLVDCLVAQGYEDITVLDLSPAALAAAKARLADRVDRIQWIAADVTTWAPSRTYDVWHDRAAFHFLVESADQAAYVERLRRALATRRPRHHRDVRTRRPANVQRPAGRPLGRREPRRAPRL